MTAEQDPPTVCTGLTARWCPIHGDCTCPAEFPGDDHSCPLHGSFSQHADPPEQMTLADIINSVHVSYRGREGFAHLLLGVLAAHGFAVIAHA